MDSDSLLGQGADEGAGAVVPDDLAVATHADQIITLRHTRNYKLSLDRLTLSGDLRGMRIGVRIADARKAAGWSQERLAKAVNQVQSTISSWERGRTEPTREDVSRIADVLGLSRAELELGHDLGDALAPVARRVPVVGTVQAGAWVEQAVGIDPDQDAVEWVYFDEPEYRRAKLFALDVRGPSVNLVYPEGVRVICALPHEVGVRADDFVVAQRRRGSLVETTIKQLVIERGGAILLYPRSSHPDFQEPIRIRHEPDSDEGVDIIGVVIARYQVGRAGHGPFLDIG
jgi:transcriptional regulator with XRE-family HTH domain